MGGGGIDEKYVWSRASAAGMAASSQIKPEASPGPWLLEVHDRLCVCATFHHRREKRERTSAAAALFTSVPLAGLYPPHPPNPPLLQTDLQSVY